MFLTKTFLNLIQVISFVKQLEFCKSNNFISFNFSAGTKYTLKTRGYWNSCSTKKHTYISWLLTYFIITIEIHKTVFADVCYEMKDINYLPLIITGEKWHDGISNVRCVFLNLYLSIRSIEYICVINFH